MRLATLMFARKLVLALVLACEWSRCRPRLKLRWSGSGGFAFPLLRRLSMLLVILVFVVWVLKLSVNGEVLISAAIE